MNNTFPVDTRQSITSNSTPQPREPNVSARAKELIGYLYELDGVQAAIRASLYGASPQDASGTSQAGDRSLEELVAMACQMAACILGEAKSIHSRL